jgi:transposase
VDTLGLLLHAIVHSAGIQDRDGGILLLATLFGQFPFLKKMFADSAYQGPIFGNALAKILPCLETEIVKRSDQAKGFVQLPKRWIVERTIAWLNRCRRLAKDWENLNRNALAFLKLASIRLTLQAKSERPFGIPGGGAIWAHLWRERPGKSGSSPLSGRSFNLAAKYLGRLLGRPFVAPSSRRNVQVDTFVFSSPGAAPS